MMKTRKLKWTVGVSAMILTFVVAIICVVDPFSSSKLEILVVSAEMKEDGNGFAEVEIAASESLFSENKIDFGMYRSWGGPPTAVASGISEVEGHFLWAAWGHVYLGYLRPILTGDVPFQNLKDGLQVSRETTYRIGVHEHLVLWDVTAESGREILFVGDWSFYSGEPLVLYFPLSGERKILEKGVLKAVPEK